LAIQVLCQLSCHFDSPTELAVYMRRDLGVAALLNQAINLPEGRRCRLSPEDVRSVRLLLGYVTGADQTTAVGMDRLASVPPAPAPAPVGAGVRAGTGAGVRQHVMLSYAWGAKKELVTAFATELRRRGYDVWRDEDGSQLVEPIGDDADTDQRMTEALERSYAAVVFVSPQYKSSFDCQVEAKKARGLVKKGQLKMLYVMVSDDYTTLSQPEACDGWLGHMVGQDAWYALFDPSMIFGCVDSIVGVLQSHALREGTLCTARVRRIGSLVALPPLRGEVVSGQAAWAATLAVAVPVITPVWSDPWSPNSSAKAFRKNVAAASAAAACPNLIDYPAMYAVLTDSAKQSNHDGLCTALDDIGITAATDLDMVNDDEFRSMLPFLKPVGQRKLLQLLRLSFE
jgi:hypothetical protein